MSDSDHDSDSVDGWPLPDKFLVELGRVAAIWSALEAQLDVCIGKLAGYNDLDDPRPFILVKHSSFPQKLDVLGAMCVHLLPKHPQLQGHVRVVGQLEAARTARSRLMHNSVGYDAVTDKMTIAIGTARRKLKARVDRVDVTEIRTVAIQIQDAMKALHTLVTGKTVS